MRGEMLSGFYLKDVSKLHNNKKETTERFGMWEITKHADGKSETWKISKDYLKTLSDSEILKLSKVMGVR
tara:strand:+ start:583 stop:792 length:210 start_codon:yes stop_codon:yes gene_type:complete